MAHGLLSFSWRQHGIFNYRRAGQKQCFMGCFMTGECVKLEKQTTRGRRSVGFATDWSL